MTMGQGGGTQETTRSEIVAAAATLLRERGASGMTTRAIAQAAGVQAPTIYRLFGDKDGLVDSVAEHVMAAYVAREARSVEAAAVDDPLADLTSAWRTHVAFGLANPELYALIGTPGRGGSSAATLAGLEVLRTRIRRLAAAGLLLVDEHRALMMIHAAGTGTVLALLGGPEAERDPGLADEMLAAVLSRITIPAPATPDPTLRSVAVTFATTIPDLPGLTAGERTLLTEWLSRTLGQLRDG